MTSSAATPDITNKKATFASQIIEWGAQHRRDFAWRTTKNVYRVLIAELMLRKTTARQVDGVYSRFIRRFPNAKVLATASQEEVRHMISSLGMEEQRSRLLIKFAIAFDATHKKSKPIDRDRLLSLPAVGEYTADVVLSLIYGKQVPIVDRNVLRVVSRFFTLPLSPNFRTGCRQVRLFLLPLMKGISSRDFNISILDFAAAICRARNPSCPICPLNVLCDYQISTSISLRSAHTHSCVCEKRVR